MESKNIIIELRIFPTKFVKRSNQQEGENRPTSENDQISEENLTQNGELSTSTNVQSLMATGERVLLQTATVLVQSNDGLKSATIKVSFDSASHCTSMTDKLG